MPSGKTRGRSDNGARGSGASMAKRKNRRRGVLQERVIA